MPDQNYIVTANSDNEHFNADCDFALVSVSPGLLRKLTRLKKEFLKQKKRFKDLGSWHVSSYDAMFISRRAAESLMGEEAFEEMDSQSGEGPYPAPTLNGVDLDKFDASHSDEMVVTVDGVWWRTFPKHSEISVGSDFFTWKWFTQCTHCGLRRDEHARGKCLFTSTAYKPLAPGLAGTLQNRRRRSPRR